MCGILGMFGSSLNLDPMAIDCALQTFKHRGPDQQFNYQCDFFAAGVNRLAINDVEEASNLFLDLISQLWQCTTEKFITINN